MKRSREPEPKHFVSVMLQLGALSRDEMAHVARSAKLMYREQCALVTAQIPEDCWRLVVAEWTAWANNLKFLCRMVCVSREWCHRITQHIRLTMRDSITKDARVLFMFPELQSLQLGCRDNIADHQLAYVTQLTELSLRDTDITTAGLKPLLRLRSLEIVGRHHGIAGKAVRDHIHLHTLKLCGTNKHLGDGLFGKLVRLTSLDLCGNEHVSDKPLRALWGLRHLGLASNSQITNEGISHMRSLVSLDLRGNDAITGDALRNMTQLTALNLSRNATVSGTTLVPLAATLKRLSLFENATVCALVLGELTSLRYLCLFGNNKIPGWVLPRLSRLETLVLGDRSLFVPSQLAGLTGLCHLVVSRHNPVMQSEHASLGQVTRLERLSLCGAPYTHPDAMKDQLQQARPALVVDVKHRDCVLDSWLTAL